jgi:hypothetical protein
LHSGGQRFDPARLHHPLSLTAQPFLKGCAVQLDELTSYREITTSELLIAQVGDDHLADLSDQKGNFVQVKYTNLRGSLREDVTIYPSSEPALGWESNALFRRSLSSSGSNQAREGRLVNALAVRGDERRDTLR